MEKKKVKPDEELIYVAVTEKKNCERKDTEMIGARDLSEPVRIRKRNYVNRKWVIASEIIRVEGAEAYDGHI